MSRLRERVAAPAFQAPAARDPAHASQPQQAFEEPGFDFSRIRIHRAPPSVTDTLQSAGRPLDPDDRSYMERGLGHDFADVRVHTDPRSALDISAAAYTAGPHVVFGGGGYPPQTVAGRRLLAHELAHVVQQRTGGSQAPLRVGEHDSALEAQADEAARLVAAGHRVTGSLGRAPGGLIQRAPLPPSDPHSEFDAMLDKLHMTEAAGQPAVDHPPDQELTTDEMNELLLIRRAEPLSIPASEVNAANEKISKIDAELAKIGEKPATKELRARRKRLLSEKARLTRGRKLGTPGQGAAAGTGQVTYAVVQVLDGNGNRLVVDFAETSAHKHAEEHLADRLRARLKGGKAKGTRIIIMTDQHVCERCRKALVAFARRFGVLHIESRVRTRARADGKGQASPRTTLRTATAPVSTDKPVEDHSEDIYRRPAGPETKPGKKAAPKAKRSGKASAKAAPEAPEPQPAHAGKASPKAESAHKASPKAEPAPDLPPPVRAGTDTHGGEPGGGANAKAPKGTAETGATRGRLKQTTVHTPHLPARPTTMRSRMMSTAGTFIVDLILDLLLTKYLQWRDNKKLEEDLAALAPAIEARKQDALAVLLSDDKAGGTKGKYYNVYIRITIQSTLVVGRGGRLLTGQPTPELVQVTISSENLNRFIGDSHKTKGPNVKEGLHPATLIWEYQDVVSSEPIE